ncbi:galactose-1-epimerase [Providencia alcalifaciens]|uniref:galactose-1-epimerase n=1 Tax=Providencia alcalifaciens TaxID=126385 RepID=UPI003BF83D50
MQFTKQQRHTLRTPKVVALTNKQGMKIILSSLGASWVSCILPLASGKRDIILGSPNMAAQMEQRVYFGATVGRVANRIANSTFELDGHTYQLTHNQGAHCQHGGRDNFSYRVWAITQPDQQQAIFTLVSSDGDQGFPGELKVEVQYELTDDNQVVISYRYQCDQDCPVNLTNYTYFNLAGEDSDRTAFEHDLQMHAPYFLPQNHEGLPTGEWREVTDTYFDFRQSKRIGRDYLQDEDQQAVGGYDHTFVFDGAVTDGQHIVATLGSPNGDVHMHMMSTSPAIHVYTGNHLVSVLGKSKTYTPFSGVVLATQYPFDGLGHAETHEPHAIIAKANHIYTNQTRYQFIF